LESTGKNGSIGRWQCTRAGAGQVRGKAAKAIGFIA
jgi:hypothetical protein